MIILNKTLTGLTGLTGLTRLRLLCHVNPVNPVIYREVVYAGFAWSKNLSKVFFKWSGDLLSYSDFSTYVQIQKFSGTTLIDGQFNQSIGILIPEGL